MDENPRRDSATGMGTNSSLAGDGDGGGGANFSFPPPAIGTDIISYFCGCSSCRTVEPGCNRFRRKYLERPCHFGASQPTQIFLTFSETAISFEFCFQISRRCKNLLVSHGRLGKSSLLTYGEISSF